MSRRRPQRDRPAETKLTGPVCQECQQRITFVVMVETGKSVPVDPIAVPDGNVCARWVARSGGGPARLTGYVISKDRPPEPGYTRYAAHFGTCVDRPRPGQPRKPKPVPPATLFD
jgi:hypothetical protein